MLTCPRSSLSFHSNAHHHGSLPQQLRVVWYLLLKADPEGPSPIFHAALRHRFHTHTGTPLHVSLQHTLVKKLEVPRACRGGGGIIPASLWQRLLVLRVRDRRADRALFLFLHRFVKFLELLLFARQVFGEGGV